MQLDALAQSLAPRDPDPRLAISAGVRRELTTFDKAYSLTRDGVRLLQELVTIRGFPTSVDGERGPATNRQLRSFRRSVGLPDTAVYDEDTHAALVLPLVEACAVPSPDKGARPAVVAAALGHAAARAREISPNSGPWVRLYMAGNQGSAWAWCAGLASFVWIQAAAAFGEDAVEAARRYRTFSCDLLAQRAIEDHRFIEGQDVARGRASILPGDLFLIQKSSRDWVHTGVVTAVHEDGTFSTVEGNTNSAGSREGLYVMERVRRTPDTRNSGVDFVRCPFDAA